MSRSGKSVKSLVPHLNDKNGAVKKVKDELQDHFKKLEKEVDMLSNNFFTNFFKGFTDIEKHIKTIQETSNCSLTEQTDPKKFKLVFDVSQFKPDEVQIITENNLLKVQAKHTQKSDNSMLYKEYHRQYLLPKNVKLDTLQTSFDKNGVLTVEADVPSAEGKNVPALTDKSK